MSLNESITEGAALEWFGPLGYAALHGSHLRPKTHAMSPKKPTPGGRAKKKAEVSLVRSSAAEYLTFVAAGGDSGASVEMRYEDENVWLTQKMMAALYDVSVPAINQHLKHIFNDNEVEENSVVKQYLIAAADGKNYLTKHYSLQAILAVGFKIENERAVQFRKWANQIVKDYTIQGWTMDAERLKQGGTLLDYDPSATATKRFVAAVQNKMHFAVHGQTAVEVIVDSEMGQMQRIVSAYLDMAEMQAMRKIPMTMEDWEKRLSGFLQLWDREIRQDAGRVTAELAKAHAVSEFEKHRIVQDRLFESDVDRIIKELPPEGGKP